MPIDEDLSAFLPKNRTLSERDDARRERDALAKRLEHLQRQCDLLTAIDGVRADTPRWLIGDTTTRRKKAQYGIANLLLSDLHLDEVVNPREMNFVNSYNRKIALYRLCQTFDRFIELATTYISGITYDGAHVWLNGDIFSGNIHEELKATNEAPIMATIDYWIDPMVEGLRRVADTFGKVHISGRVGNHGRNTYKPVMKSRVQDNFDWLFYRILEREFRGDPRVTWDLPLSADGVPIKQYETRYLATHGDQFRGGSGISGILTPLALGDHRKSRRQAALHDSYDYMLLGHFHQYTLMPRVLVNGSLKGYDEYASLMNFGFEVPQQAFWVTTPSNGMSFNAAIRPSNRKAEGW